MYAHYPDFAGHELVTSRQEPGVGLSALIAIHNTRLGPAIGGCRIFPYRSMGDAVTDVLRLSRGMTYKTAIAQIPYGGGKAVIMADPDSQKTVALLQAMGDFVESLQGRYITSFDSGTTLEDVDTIGTHTRFPAGTMAEAGNASASTAYGVCQCIKVAAAARLGRQSLEGVHVAIQGVGNVGSRVAQMLRKAGATLTIADLDPRKADQVASQLDAQVVSADEVHRVRADVFSPCALGGALSARTIPEFACKAIVGGANNQLATAADDQRLLEAGILYCPDYLANAGGIIDLHYQRSGWSREAVERHIDRLAETFCQVIQQSAVTQVGTARIADRIAESRFHPDGLP